MALLGRLFAGVGVPLAPVGEGELQEIYVPYRGSGAADPIRPFQPDLEAVAQELRRGVGGDGSRDAGLLTLLLLLLLLPRVLPGGRHEREEEVVVGVDPTGDFTDDVHVFENRVVAVAAAVIVVVAVAAFVQ